MVAPISRMDWPRSRRARMTVRLSSSITPRPNTVLAALPCYFQPVLRRAPATHSLRAAALLQNDELPLALERVHDAVDTVGRACEGDSDALPFSCIERLRLTVRSALDAGAVLLVCRLEHGSDPRLRVTLVRGHHPVHGALRDTSGCCDFADGLALLSTGEDDCALSGIEQRTRALSRLDRYTSTQGEPLDTRFLGGVCWPWGRCRRGLARNTSINTFGSE